MPVPDYETAYMKCRVVAICESGDPDCPALTIRPECGEFWEARDIVVEAYNVKNGIHDQPVYVTEFKPGAPVFLPGLYNGEPYNGPKSKVANPKNGRDGRFFHYGGNKRQPMTVTEAESTVVDPETAKRLYLEQSPLLTVTIMRQDVAEILERNGCPRDPEDIILDVFASGKLVELAVADAAGFLYQRPEGPK